MAEELVAEETQEAKESEAQPQAEAQPQSEAQPQLQAHEAPAAQEAPSANSARLRAYAIILAIACLLTLVPLVAIAPFDRPSADDFSYSLITHASVQDTGDLLKLIGAAAQTSAEFYQNWQGLYTSAFCLSLQPGIFGAEYYQIGAYIMLACILFACLYFAFACERWLFKQRTHYWLAAGLLLATYLLQCMPAINEAVYWYNGAANYTPWVFACLVTSGLSITALCARKPRRRSRALFIACILSLIVSGSNYMPAFLNIMLMFGFACIGISRKRFGHLLPLIVAIIGFAISAMAPGTAIRQAMFPDHPGIPSALAHSIWESLVNLHLFTDVSLLIALLLATPFIARWVMKSRIKFTGKGLVAVIALTCLGMVGLLCVPIYSTGGLGAGRIYNTAFEAFGVSAFVIYAYVLGFVLQNENTAKALRGFVEKVPAAVAPVLAVVGVGALVFFGSITVGHGTSYIAARELVSGEAAAYAAEYDAREALIMSADGTVEVSALTTKPQTLFFSDFVGDGYDWTGSVATYYGLIEVTFVE